MYRRMIHRRYRGRRYAVLLLILALLAGATWLVYRHQHRLYNFFLRNRAYDPLIEAAARRYGLDPLLLKAVVWQESRFNPNATGGKGEVGLMQIRPERGAADDWAMVHGRQLPPRTVLYHPSFNLEIGAWYLGRAMQRWQGYHDQVALALSEYNAGLRGMRPWVPTYRDDPVVENISIASTKEYVKAILARYHEYCSHREAQE